MEHPDWDQEAPELEQGIPLEELSKLLEVEDTED
jgi:hypothetical protein